MLAVVISGECAFTQPAYVHARQQDRIDRSLGDIELRFLSRTQNTVAILPASVCWLIAVPESEQGLSVQPATYVRVPDLDSIPV